MPNIRSTSLEMSTATAAEEMRRFVMIAADARPWGDNLKARLHRAARVLGISPRRARAIYYREAKVIGADEYLAAKKIADDIKQNASAVRAHDEMASQG